MFKYYLNLPTLLMTINSILEACLLGPLSYVSQFPLYPENELSMVKGKEEKIVMTVICIWENAVKNIRLNFIFISDK